MTEKNISKLCYFLVFLGIVFFLNAPSIFAAVIPKIKTWISDSHTSGPHTYRFEFILEQPAMVRLHYGTTIHLEKEVVRDIKPSHVILLKDLEPSTRYFYQFELIDKDGAKNILPGRSFRTPASGEDVKEKNEMPAGYVPVSFTIAIPEPTFHQLDDWFFIPYQFSHNKEIIPNIRNVKIIPGATSAVLSWETSDESYTPDVWYGDTPTNQQQWVDVSQGDRKHFSTTLEGLRPNSTYYIHVASYLHSSGGTTLSRDFSFTTPSGGGSQTIPIDDTSSPRVKRITYYLAYSKTTLTITTDELSRGLLEYGTTRNFGTQIPTPEGMNHSFTIDGLVAGSEYYAQATLQDLQGNKSIIQFLIKAPDQNDQEKNLDLPVRPKPNIALKLSIDKKSITLGESTTLRWSTSDARPNEPGTIVCSATGGWGGNKNISWSESSEAITPLAVGTYTYTLMCYKDTVLAVTRSVVLTVKSKIEKKTTTPSQTQSQSSSSAQSNISPKTIPPTSSTSSLPPPPPPIPPFGPPVGQMNTSAFFQQPSGPSTQSITPPPPAAKTPDPITITLKVTPSNTVIKGSKYGVRWEAKNANSCTALGDWSGKKPLKGTKDFIADKNKTYYLFCEVTGGENKVTSVGVTVKNPAVTKKPTPAKKIAKKAVKKPTPQKQVKKK